MKQISKVFLACACSLSGLTTQAQDQTVWSNDFSNASQPLNTVGRGVCRVNDGVFHSRSAYALVCIISVKCWLSAEIARL